MKHEKRSTAKSTVKDILRSPTNYNIIHYSCGSFGDSDVGISPRITSIAVYYMHDQQTKTFSIHQVAERENVQNKIEENYERLEAIMLEEFFELFEKERQKTWIHWNMISTIYGFEALVHRYCVLTKKRIDMSLINKVCLPKLISNIYGVTPKMYELIERNNIHKANQIMLGKQEAQAFKNKEYTKMHMSTLRKVIAFSQLIEKITDDELLIDTTWKNKYGLSMQGIFQWSQDEWIGSFIMFIIGAIIGGLITKFLFG